MDYHALRGAFMVYFQRRDLVKLLVLELEANHNRLQSMRIPEAERGSRYSVSILETETIQRLMADTFSLIGDDAQLISLLYTIREHSMLLNQRIEAFLREIALPTTGHYALLVRHNEFIGEMIDKFSPLFVDAVDRLRAKFQLRV